MKHHTYAKAQYLLLDILIPYIEHSELITNPHKAGMHDNRREISFLKRTDKNSPFEEIKI